MGILSSTGLFGGALAAILLALAYADVRRMILPDGLNAFLALGGLAQSFSIDLPSPVDAGFGALFGGGLFFLVGLGFRRLRGYDGLGLGDVEFPRFILDPR